MRPSGVVPRGPADRSWCRRHPEVPAAPGDEAPGDEAPVAAAGGTVDGRGLAAAIVLGAAGAPMGTRFVAMSKSRANDGWERALTAGPAGTVLSGGSTGQLGRFLRNGHRPRGRGRREPAAGRPPGGEELRGPPRR